MSGSFYDATPEPDVQPATPTPTSAMASTLYATTAPVVDKTASAEVQAARAADVGRALYATDKLFHGSGLDEVDGLDHVAAAEVMRDMGADPSDARQLVTLVQSMPQATLEDHGRWVTETSRVDAAEMAMARDYLKTDPRARAFIERHPGLEYEPTTVRRVIALAKAAAVKKGSK